MLCSIPSKLSETDTGTGLEKRKRINMQIKVSVTVEKKRSCIALPLIHKGFTDYQSGRDSQVV